MTRLVCALALVFTACSDDAGRGEGFPGGEAGVVEACPTDSIECPDTEPAPTYTDDVAPLLDAHCTGCHGPGGENEDVPLTSYRLIATDKTAKTAISDVLGCKMPPAPLPRLDAAERQTLVCWLARGKPQ
jgi:mono/diheme cytochrome c family protein